MFLFIYLKGVSAELDGHVGRSGFVYDQDSFMYLFIYLFIEKICCQKAHRTDFTWEVYQGPDCFFKNLCQARAYAFWGRRTCSRPQAFRGTIEIDMKTELLVLSSVTSTPRWSCFYL